MKVRKTSISLKIFIAIIALLILSDVLMGVLMYNKAKGALVTQIKENAMNVDRCVAASVSGDLLALINQDSLDSEEYAKIIEELALFRDNSGVEYVYTLGLDGSQHAVFLVDSDPDEPGLPGEDFGEWSD